MSHKKNGQNKNPAGLAKAQMVKRLKSTVMAFFKMDFTGIDDAQKERLKQNNIQKIVDEMVEQERQQMENKIAELDKKVAGWFKEGEAA